MAELVDTNVLIGLERRRLPLDGLTEVAEGGEHAIASITASELLVGVHLAGSPAFARNRETFVQQILEGLPIFSFDLEAARTHAKIWADLRVAGQLIDPHDLIIAATALARGYSVLTDNVREFERIPGLTVRRPAW